LTRQIKISKVETIKQLDADNENDAKDKKK
jgi:hypothetical protein